MNDLVVENACQFAASVPAQLILKTPAHVLAMQEDYL